MLLPDGTEFEFKEKTEPIGAGVPTNAGNQGSAVSSASNESISYSVNNINDKISVKETNEFVKIDVIILKEDINYLSE